MPSCHVACPMYDGEPNERCLSAQSVYLYQKVVPPRTCALAKDEVDWLIGVQHREGVGLKKKKMLAR